MHKSMFEMLQALIRTDDIQGQGLRAGEPIRPVLTIKPGERRRVRFIGRPYHYFLSVGKAIYRTGEPCRVDAHLQTRWTAPHMEREHADFEGQTYNIFDPADYNSNETPKNPVVERYRALIIDRDSASMHVSAGTGQIKQLDFGSELFHHLREYCDAFGKSFCEANAHSFMITHEVCNSQVRERATPYDDEALGVIPDSFFIDLEQDKDYHPQIFLEIQANSPLEIRMLREAADKHGTYNPERRCSDQVTPFLRTFHQKNPITKPTDCVSGVPIRQDIHKTPGERLMPIESLPIFGVATYERYEAQRLTLPEEPTPFASLRDGYLEAREQFTNLPSGFQQIQLQKDSHLSPKNPSKVVMVCCPYHDDLNPSAVLSHDGTSFRCYTCHGKGPVHNGVPCLPTKDEIDRMAWESDSTAQLAEARDTIRASPLIGDMWNSNIHVETDEQKAKNAAIMQASMVSIVAAKLDALKRDKNAKLTEAAEAAGCKIDIIMCDQPSRSSDMISKEDVQKSYDFVQKMEAGSITIDQMEHATIVCDYVSPSANMEHNGEYIAPKCDAKGEWVVMPDVHTTQEAREMEPKYCCSKHLARMLDSRGNNIVRAIDCRDY